MERWWIDACHSDPRFQLFRCLSFAPPFPCHKPGLSQETVDWKTTYQSGKCWIKMVNIIVGYNGLKLRVVFIALSKHVIKHAILQFSRDYMLGLKETKRN